MTDSEDDEHFKREMDSKYRNFMDGIIPMHICHLHNSVRHTEPKIYYTFRNIVYRNVKILGIVVEKTLFTKDDVILTVDDGTAQIKCIIQREDINKDAARVELFTNKLEELLTEKREYDALETEQNILFNNVALMLLKRCIDQTDELGIKDDYKNGSCVTIIGKMSELYERNIMYVSKIRKISLIDEPIEKERHLDLCKHLLEAS